VTPPDDVRALIAEERLVEAAALLGARGDHLGASQLYERACSYVAAAEEAARAGLPGQALLLAVQGGADALAAAQLPSLAEDPKGAERAAYMLGQRGDHAWAAQVYEALAQSKPAAAAWDRAGEGARAARLLESLGDVIGAAKTLELSIKRAPERADLRLALGQLLLRYGKPEAAVRHLQQVPEQCPEHRAALAALVEAFGTLGLEQARGDAAEQLRAAGGAPVPSPSTPQNVDEGAVRPRFFGRYVANAEVSQSQTARVVDCLDVVRNERVALKLFAAQHAAGAGRDALTRFEREVRVLRSLEHPNIVPLRDYVAEGPALVLAWMAGGTLGQMLERGPLAPARAVEIASSVLLALGEAHRLGVLHRDIKPANVLFDGAGTARLSDFGVAHLSDLSSTATAGILGTFGYMSPEQREGRPASVQSDIYGVGAILWEMLTGERPPESETQVRPSGVHRDLGPAHDACVLSFLCPEPGGRPRDAFAARSALSSVAWPTTIERATAPLSKRPSVRPASPEESDERIAQTAHHATFDTWIERPVVTLAVTEASRERIRAFARVQHRALQAVFRLDKATSTAWFEHIDGWRPAQPLTRAQTTMLDEAIGALHREGIVHGHVDADHVRVRADGSVRLLYAEGVVLGSMDQDRLALARL
jgi:serine/threonine protein kinase